MRTAQLEYFVAVAETLSFTRASELCHVAQPAISQQIQSLEKELGFSLFARSTKGVELTPAGRQYYQDVSGVLAALQRADRHASAIAHGQAGTLDIGVASSGQSEIFRVISRFHALHPEISIGLHRAISRTQGEQLRNGTYDTAPAPLCAFESRDGLAQAYPAVEPLRIIMSDAHPLAARRTLSIEDLLPYPHIVADTPGIAQHPDITLLRAEDQGIAWMMMSLGLGIEAVPETVIASLERGYVMREVQGYEAALEIGWVHLIDNENPALATFLDFLDHQEL